MATLINSWTIIYYFSNWECCLLEISCYYISIIFVKKKKQLIIIICEHKKLTSLYLFTYTFWNKFERFLLVMFCKIENNYTLIWCTEQLNFKILYFYKIYCFIYKKSIILMQKLL